MAIYNVPTVNVRSLCIGQAPLARSQATIESPLRTTMTRSFAFLHFFPLLAVGAIISLCGGDGGGGVVGVQAAESVAAPPAPQMQQQQHRHRLTLDSLVLLADEVYQENVYEGEFYSCRRAAYDTGLLGQLELVSFHSVSKGVFGECGRRGGYMELSGFDPAVTDEIYKIASSTLCATVTGQIMTALMVRGPKPGDASYESHEAEKRAIYESLKRRSKIVSSGLNEIPGFSCQKASGSMYCFPSVQLPASAVQQAKANGESPDSLYCKSLLRRTGICVVPASGFGQREGRFGFRTTFLPSEAEMERCVDLFRRHHEEFCQTYT